MPSLQPAIWKEAPFIRLIIPLISGITSAWYLHIGMVFIWNIFFFVIAMFLSLELHGIFIQFKYNRVKGILLNIILFCLGWILAWYDHHPNRVEWANHFYKKGDIVIARLEEPLTERPKSLKAQASVLYLIRNHNCIKTEINIFLYIQKDSLINSLPYGTIIIFEKAIQPIKNIGNPETFDYRRYCDFQHIYGQVYLQKKEFIVSSERKENPFKKYLLLTQQKIISILQTYIKGKKESGLAEALLIGYKDDLDKNLIQSYTHTGVVHIIAISGLHLALIYELLQFFLKIVGRKRIGKWLKPIILISSLWIFSFLTGASPSVLRSAVMFSFIIIGNSFSKSSSIYNSLAASAFLLLCYNPFWLWDIGFQLSYTAVLSIVIFMRPVYNWFFIRNKLLDLIWKSASVTLAAQILTTPVSIYHFHQFPNYFLFSNLLAVPLSSIVLLGELFVCCIAFIPTFVKIAGAIVSWLITLLNSFIEHMEKMPYSMWEHLYINLYQLIFMYIVIIGISLWLLEKNKFNLSAGLIALMCFVSIRTFSFWSAQKQNMLIVYNVPQHKAIDLFEARKYQFIADSAIANNDTLQNLYIQPARMKYRVSFAHRIDYAEINNKIFRVGTKKIMIIDQPTTFIPIHKKIFIDIIIISQNPILNISNLTKVFDCRQLVFDASNTRKKIIGWKKECEQCGISFYIVADKGAFITNGD